MYWDLCYLLIVYKTQDPLFPPEGTFQPPAGLPLPPKPVQQGSAMMHMPPPPEFKVEKDYFTGMKPPKEIPEQEFSVLGRPDVNGRPDFPQYDYIGDEFWNEIDLNEILGGHQPSKEEMETIKATLLEEMKEDPALFEMLKNKPKETPRPMLKPMKPPMAPPHVMMEAANKNQMQHQKEQIMAMYDSAPPAMPAMQAMGSMPAAPGAPPTGMVAASPYQQGPPQPMAVSNMLPQPAGPVNLEQVAQHNQQNNILAHVPVAICDGNLKMTVYISSTEPLTFGPDRSAGLCNQDSPDIYLNHQDGEYSATFTINLETCHESIRDIEGTQSITLFNAPISVKYNQNGQDIHITPQCLFTSDYIVDEILAEETASTSAVVGQDTAQIDDNLQFEFEQYETAAFETRKASGNSFNPHEPAHFRLVPGNGFNPSHLLAVPTACYILQDDGNAFKAFEMFEDINDQHSCDFPMWHSKKWGFWEIDLDLPTILHPSPYVSGYNYKIECAVKVCPNQNDSQCSNFIRDCHTRDSTE